MSVPGALGGGRGARGPAARLRGQPAEAVDPRAWALGAWLSLGAVLYFTLLPFRFGDLSVREAWEVYRAMELYELGARGRQQWIANVLMFVPLGFAWTGWLAGRARGTGARIAAGLAVALLGLAVTLSVEFVQVWIPARMPSPIDISGNFTGAVVGVALWFALAPRLGAWRAALRTRGIEVALSAYVLAYVAASLLPFDFLLSAAELRHKIGSDHWGLWAAGAGCGAGLRCSVVRALEFAACIPVGIWAAMRLRAVPGGWFAGLGAGLAFGLALEVGQFLTVSGVAEGRSALLRALGVVAGMAVHARRQGLRARAVGVVCHGRALVLCAAVPYVVLLVTVNVGIRGFHGDPARALATLAETSLLPFHYHYLVPESVAIASVLFHVAMYAPVGVLVWLWGRGEGRAGRARVAAVWGAGLAAVMETAKPFYDGRHPDYTDVLIGAAAAAAAFAIVAWLWRQAFGTAAPRPGAIGDGGDGVAVSGAGPVRREDHPDPDPDHGHAPAPGGAAREAGGIPTGAGGAAAPIGAGAGLAAPAGEGSAARGRAAARDTRATPDARATPLPFKVLGAALGAATLWAALVWPVAGGWLALGLVAYAALLWRRPEAWLLVIPMLVPVLDLSLYTGRIVVDELDLFVLATLAVAAWRWRPGRGLEPLPRAARWALGLFALSLVASVFIGLYPWRMPDANDWAQYTSPYNGLRAAKGFAWALLLYALLRQSDRPVGWQLRSWFVPGMAAGLAIGLVVVLVERITWPGLLDFDSRYRIVGAFTDMRAGGPGIETWLVMAAPFALLWGWQQRSMAGLACALTLLALALFAVAVTYSRGGYLGMGVALLIVIVGVAAAAMHSSGHDDTGRDTGTAPGRRRRARLALLCVLPVIALFTIGGQVAGGFADQRIARIGDDLGQRLAHWSLARDLSRAAGGAGLFGHGAGSFPRHYLAGNPQGRVPGNFRIADGPEGAMLRIGTGDSLYINQRLDLPRAGDYRLRARIRSEEAGSVLRLFVCEKHVRHSFACRSTGWAAGDDAGAAARGSGGWVERAWTFSLAGFDDRPWPVRRGLTLALAWQGEGLVDIDRIELFDADGGQHVRNAAFDNGMRHWYMTTDHLWPWRVENQLIETWFDQGWLGLLALVVLVTAAVVHLARGALRGDLRAAFLLAAIAGALVVGLFGTIFWSPRLMMLFFLILIAALLVPAPSRDP